MEKIVNLTHFRNSSGYSSSSLSWNWIVRYSFEFADEVSERRQELCKVWNHMHIRSHYKNTLFPQTENLSLQCWVKNPKPQSTVGKTKNKYVADIAIIAIKIINGAGYGFAHETPPEIGMLSCIHAFPAHRWYQQYTLVILAVQYQSGKYVVFALS